MSGRRIHWAISRKLSAWGPGIALGGDSLWSGLKRWRLILSAHHIYVLFSLLLLSCHIHIVPNDRLGPHPYYFEIGSLELEDIQSGIQNRIDHSEQLVDGE